MERTKDLLKNVLIDIEKGIKNNITAFTLSKRYNLSEIHLRRLFSFAFNRPISGYIRSRTLSESLNDLLHTDKNIIDIALEYGFGFENSYSRSFKREFGISPDNFRKSRKIIKIQLPLYLYVEKTRVRQYNLKNYQMEKVTLVTKKSV